MDLRKLIHELLRHRDELDASADVNAVIAVNVGRDSYLAEIPCEERVEGDMEATPNEGGDGDGQV